MDVKKIIGANLSWLLYKNGENQAELSRATGVEQGNISSYVLGRSAPSIENLIKITKHYGITAEELFTLQHNLKECPFCGAVGKIGSTINKRYLIDIKHGEGCFLEALCISPEFSSKDALTVAWNTRSAGNFGRYAK